MGSPQERGNVPPPSEITKRVNQIANNPEFWDTISRYGEKPVWINGEDHEFSISGLAMGWFTNEMEKQERKQAPMKVEDILRKNPPKVTLDDALQLDRVKAVID